MEAEHIFKVYSTGMFWATSATMKKKKANRKKARFLPVSWLGSCWSDPTPPSATSCPCNLSSPGQQWCPMEGIVLPDRWQEGKPGMPLSCLPLTWVKLALGNVFLSPKQMGLFSLHLSALGSFDLDISQLGKGFDLCRTLRQCLLNCVFYMYWYIIKGPRAV